MEMQNKRMYDDEEYLALIGDFFLEQIVQGSINTQIYRSMSEIKNDKQKESKNN